LGEQGWGSDRPLKRGGKWVKREQTSYRKWEKKANPEKPFASWKKLEVRPEENENRRLA